MYVAYIEISLRFFKCITNQLDIAVCFYSVMSVEKEKSLHFFNDEISSVLDKGSDAVSHLTQCTEWNLTVTGNPVIGRKVFFIQYCIFPH